MLVFRSIVDMVNANLLTSGMSAIFHDLDGTLTNYTNGFVTWYTPYLEFPECEVCLLCKW